MSSNILIILFGLLLSRAVLAAGNSVCYGDLGCFTNDAPWYTMTRLFPLPQSPEDIDVHICLHTRNNLKGGGYAVKLRPYINLADSDFDSKRSNTCFIIHGFWNSGNDRWLMDMGYAYLQRRNANVFLVDWEKGASGFNYFQAAANTRVVAAELIRFVKHLIDEYNLHTGKIHLLGHSLGAHISSYVGKEIPNIGHLTGFDPAQPGFEGHADEVRLVKGDSNFVEIIHTSGQPLITSFGFGYINPAGDIDYFMNGGKSQPGCRLYGDKEDQVNLAHLTNYTKKVLIDWLSCSHNRAYVYYTEALLSVNNCTFWGKSVHDVAHISTSDELQSCNLENCSPLGLESKNYPARGNFNVITNSFKPYCIRNPNVTKEMVIQKDRYYVPKNNGAATFNRYLNKFSIVLTGLVLLTYTL